MSIEKTLQQYKTLEDLQQFAVAQQSTIIQLSKKIQRLEEERNHLKQLLESSVPLIKKEGETGVEKFLTSAEESICIMQLEKLRDISTGRELTLEETRRVEIFSKILATFRNMPKTIELKNKETKTEDLLKLVESDDGNK